MFLLPRQRRPANLLAQNTQPTPHESSLKKAAHFNQSETDTSLYDTIPENIVTPVAELVYQTEQSRARGAKKKPQDNLQTSPDVALDELYSKPNKQRKPRNDLEIKNMYAEVKPRNTEQQVDSRETLGDDDVIMVENELYS